MLMKNERDIVVPGECIAEGLEYLPSIGTFREANKICSKVLGMVVIKERVITVVPLAGVYTPRVGDKIIGEIADVQLSTWYLDINSPYQASLSAFELEEFVERGEDISKFYDVGDLLYAKVINVTKQKAIQLSMRDPMCKKLRGGRVVTITPSKVPRLIGREGSMINMIKDATKCYIVIGQNGLVWLKGEKEDLATEAILMVDRESHMEGLTNKISEFLGASQQPQPALQPAPQLSIQPQAEEKAEDKNDELKVE